MRRLANKHGTVGIRPVKDLELESQTPWICECTPHGHGDQVTDCASSRKASCDTVLVFINENAIYCNAILLVKSSAVWSSIV